MNRFRWLILLLAVGIFVGNATFAQDPKEPKTDPKTDPASNSKSDPAIRTYRGQLPQNWKLLGLTDEQRQEVYKRQTIYREMIDELELKIEELKAKQRKELEDVLTAEQRKRLREIYLGKSPSEK